MNYYQNLLELTGKIHAARITAWESDCYKDKGLMEICYPSDNLVILESINEAKRILFLINDIILKGEIK